MSRPDEQGQVPGWALPGELATAHRRPHRTVRDWTVDVTLFLFAGLWWLWGYFDYVRYPSAEYAALIDDWMMLVDPYLGGAVCLALWWRRRWPVLLGAVAVASLLVSSTVTGAVLVALFTVAVHRGWPVATSLSAAAMAQGLWWSLVYQPPGLPQPIFMTYLVLMFGVPLGWGLMVRVRRQLLLSLRRDAQRERDERDRRLDEARRTERARIAREMHDVLAHRISLLSVHAGALAYRTAQAEAGAGQALSAAEVGQAVEVIRDNAHRALTELGEVLTVLRAGEPTDEASGRPPPQPRLADLPRLVEEARAAGQPVTCHLAETVAQAPEQEQRTAFRIVQEGLTNARKHAPYAEVAVRISGEPGSGMLVSVSNPLPVGITAAEIPGAGAGLTGLAERVNLDGGHLSHGAVDGEFALQARLPWQP